MAEINYRDIYCNLLGGTERLRQDFETDPFALHDAFLYWARHGRHKPPDPWIREGLAKKLESELNFGKGGKHVVRLRKTVKREMLPFIRFETFNWFLLQKCKENKALKLAALALETTPGAIKHARDGYKKAHAIRTKGKVELGRGFEDMRPSEVTFGPDEDVLAFLLKFRDLPDDVLKRFVSACMKIPACKGYRHDFLEDFRRLAPENHKLFLAAYEGRPFGTRYRFLSKFRTIPQENHRLFLLKIRAENPRK